MLCEFRIIEDSKQIRLQILKMQQKLQFYALIRPQSMVGDCIRRVRQFLTSEEGIIEIVLREVIFVIDNTDMPILSAEPKLHLLCCIKD